MGKMKKKYEAGEASHYMTRKQALQKLQLSLKMFRRLCIIKGIYPREPKNRKRAQKGSTEKKTLYLKKDIQFLLHEPIVWKFREHKVYMRKKGRAIALRDFKGLQRVIAAKPTYSLDHIVKERYPSFIDAIRDLDDCLTLTFLFSTFPSMRYVPSSLSSLCRRLTLEFLHYVIEERSLRKVFVSIKGYYYEAEILGQRVTWVMPHTFGFQPQSPNDVDFRIMATFVEFYATLLGFINFRLFTRSNICYPPKLGSILKETEAEFVDERISSLNSTILRLEESGSEPVPEVDEFQLADGGEGPSVRGEQERLEKLKKLFSSLKVFLNREVPREALTLCIRAFGGTVSWEELFPGSTYPESDETITHQIMDRPFGEGEKKYLSRFYIQPQWIFDSINGGSLVPLEPYFIGSLLPPHLSPFGTEREGDYVPPEQRSSLSLILGGGDEDGERAPFDIEEQKKQVKMRVSRKKEEEGVRESEKISETDMLTIMGVERGEAEFVDRIKERENETKEQYRLRVMMIRNKHKRLYRKMMDSRKKRRKEAEKMEKKRNKLSSASTPVEDQD